MFLVCLLLKKDGESLVNNFLFQRAAKLSFSTDGSISIRFVFLPHSWLHWKHLLHGSPILPSAL